MRSLALVFVALASIASFAACGSDDSGGSPGGSGGSGGTAGAGGSAGQGDIPAPGELKVIEPGAPTVCSRGTPFRYFVMGGDPKKVVIDFEGGGACWNSVTCSIKDSIFQAEAPSAAEIQTMVDNKSLGGMYRLDKSENPLNGWTLVHIPYCTGDIHWGDAEKQYSPELTIQHKGFVNAQTVLQWVYEHYDPEQILVTGCSAGAYGAIGHSAWIAQHYSNAKISVLADSGAGIVTDNFFKDSFPNWNAQLPTFVAGLKGKDIQTLTIVDLYTAIANEFPNMRVAQYDTAFDKDQTFYYSAMGGNEADWSPKMMQSLTDISAAAGNFRYYMAPGPVHCVTPYDLFYERETGGVKLTSWLGELVDGADAPATAKCEGAACKDGAFCNACLANTSTDPACKWCEGWTP